MRDNVKQRVVGGAVLVALVVIFAPVLFNLEPSQPLDTETLIPPAPDVAPVQIPSPQRVEGLEPPPPADQAFLPPVPEQPEEKSAATDGSDEPESGEADRPSLSGNSPDAWLIQVASFRDRAVSDDLAARLQEAGYKAYVRAAQADGVATYRVYVGPVSLISRAEAQKAEIDARFKVESIVVRFKP